MRNIILIITIFLNSTNLFSQKINRIEIGTGIGTNSLSWSIYDTLNKSTSKILRNKLDLIPVVRISIQKDLIIKKNYVIGFQPFICNYTFGGSSKKESNGYQDKIRLNSVELGIIPNITINKHFQIGLGAKEQYIFRATSRSFGYIDKGITDSTTWKNYDAENWFKQTAFNLGLNIKYVKYKYSLGFEYWHGITNLNKILIKEFKPMIRDINTRIIFTYNLKTSKKSARTVK